MIYNILNGDALQEKFPSKLDGQIIVMRECLVEGPVDGNSLKQIFGNRAEFMSKAYQIPPDGYKAKSENEIMKVSSIPGESEINLWFEDDLFCQVNMWFVIQMIMQNASPTKVCLVRPTTDLKYGFGGMQESDLLQAFEKKQTLSDNELTDLATLWRCFQLNDFHNMEKIANNNKENLQFLLPAVEAQKSRFPDTGEGKPHKLVRQIVDEIGDKDFGKIFRAFWERAPIYGFGDMQVKRIFDEILESS